MPAWRRSASSSSAWVGVPLLLGTMAIIVLLGPRLLPNRSGRSIPADLSKHARTLIEHYTLDDGLFQLRVRSDSPYVGAERSRRRSLGAIRA